MSLRGRAISFLLKHRHAFKPKQTEDWSTYEAILRFRQEVEEGAKRFGKLPPGITVVPNQIDSLYTEWILPDKGTSDKVMLYFHGGGYVSGTCQDHRSIVAKFVRGSGIKSLLFEYRLAPENPHPAALDDAIKAYEWLLGQGIAAQSISFVGDSGGGGLALGTVLAVRDKGLPLPSRVVVLSPMTDLQCTGESHRTNAKKCLSPEGTALAFGKHYAGANDVTLPYISPLYGELSGLPPMLIYAGEEESLRDDAVMFAEKARAAGTPVTLRVGNGLFHCYPAMAPLFPEATAAMAEICRFVNGS